MFDEKARRELQAALNAKPGPGPLRISGAIVFTAVSIGALFLFLPQIRQALRVR